MNVDQAKVPKVDGDWRSIEIFLFSNGQQYSPPRKYFLGVDDLNVWAATLNQLGQSQYGLQSPPIDLYTTDGQLVEGPLELRDGHAYVAVVLPDTFIDAGYQKYLLKASRSWEKRQARKKIPECIRGEPCCECPEKEWCSDLQRCCLCAEKEDAEITSLLIRSSGQLGVKSPGYFMSSAPTKPDGYEPLSKIEGARADQHEVSLDKYGYSSVLVQARPDDNEVKLVDHAARSVKYDARSSENALIPGENEPRLSKNGAKLGEYELNTGKKEPSTGKDEAREPGSQRCNIEKDANEIEKEKSLNDNNDKPNKDTNTSNTSQLRKHTSKLNLIGESELEKKGENAVKDCVNSDEPTGRKNDTGIAVDAPTLKKNENARNLSDIDYEVRIAEPTREFDLGSRTSESKSEEINPADKIVGQYEAKQGEQIKKQDDHVARLNCHVSKGDDHEAGLENSERSAKMAASGPKTAPRDKFSSRVRNSVQHKLGIPSTIIDEAATKLDESEIKDRVTARKNSLPTGRLSTEKKRLSIGQNSSLLRKPTPTCSVLRKSEDKKSIKPNKEIDPKKTPGISSTAPNSASSDKSKPSKFPHKRITPPDLPLSTISDTNLLKTQESPATDKGPLENVPDVKQATDISTYLFNNQESELKSSMLTSVKPVDDISNFPEETQTELNFENSKPLTDSKEVQTEAVEQQGKDVGVCNQLNYKIATIDPDENIISILNKGDIINLKLNIEVRNILRSVHSSEKNTPKSRSLTDIRRSEKESQKSIDGNKFVKNNTLQTGGNDQPFQGYGFEGSPKVMIVQCAGCGMLNNPALRDLPPRSDNDKNYLALLTNPVHEDNTNDSSLQIQPCDQKQSQTRKPCCGTNPKSAFSELTLDTITTVTVSGGPSVKRDMGNCATTNNSCRGEEPQNDCVLTKRKVNITDDSCTKCSFQKQSVSSLSVTTYVDDMSNCVKTCKYKEIQVCSEFWPPICPGTCQKVQSVCSKANVQIYPLVQSKGCQPICPQAQTQTQGFLLISPTCLPCCPGPPSTPVSPQGCTPPSLPTCLPCCSKPPQTPTRPPCCPKVPPTPACPQECPTPPLPTCPPCCPKPPPTPTRPPCCPKSPPIAVCPRRCMPPSPRTCPPCCPKPPPTIIACPQRCMPPPPSCCSKPAGLQIQTQLCPQGSQFCDAQTQTRWASIALQARLHCDGRYSFHLPPLDMLNSYPI